MTRVLTAKTLTPLTTSPRLPLIAALAVRFACAVTLWDQRYRSRNELKYMDDHLLKDIGVTRRQADIEAIRPFWDG